MSVKTTIMNIISEADFYPHVIQLVDSNFNSKYKSTVYMPFAQEYETNPLMYVSDSDKLNDSLLELIHLKDEYIRKNIDLSIFYKTILDLNYRIDKYYKKYESYGLEADDLKWLSFIFRLEMFDIGTLRFQLFHLSYAEIERSGFETMNYPAEWKQKLPEGTPIVNVHILANTDLSKQSVSKSFELATMFFREHFNDHDYEYYFCRSWMTYPALKDLFSDTSNIVNFINLFENIAQHDNTTQALNRIYNTVNIEEIEAMEKQTSLQKKAYLNLDKLGVGLGIKKK